MSVAVRLSVELGVELFDIEEAGKAMQLADATGGAVYCWKTVGRSNRLERGLSIVDVLGLVVLPQGLPSILEMPDDPPEWV